MAYRLSAAPHCTIDEQGNYRFPLIIDLSTQEDRMPRAGARSSESSCAIAMQRVVIARERARGFEIFDRSE